MKLSKSNVGIIITLSLCVVAIVGSAVVYGQKEKEYKAEKKAVEEQLIEDKGKIKTPNRVVDEKLSADDSVPTAVDKVVEEPLPPPVTEESVNEDEKLAKLWFDLRQPESDGSQLPELVSGLEVYLKTGGTPQVVSNFNLSLVSSEDYGFQEKSVRTDAGTVKLVTMLAPTSVEENKRITTFVVYEQGDGYNVSVWEDMNLVPFDIGYELFGETFNIYVSGHVVNEDLFSEKGSVGFYALKYKDQAIEPVELTGFNVPNVNSSIVNGVLNLSSLDGNVVPFFYIEYENEGESTGKLLLALESNQGSEVYSISQQNGKINLTLEEVYGE